MAAASANADAYPLAQNGNLKPGRNAAGGSAVPTARSPSICGSNRASASNLGSDNAVIYCSAHSATSPLKPSGVVSTEQGFFVATLAIIHRPFLILTRPEARFMKHGKICFALYLLWFLSLFPLLCGRYEVSPRPDQHRRLRCLEKFSKCTRQPDRVSQVAADHCGDNADRFAGSSHIPGEALSCCPTRPRNGRGD